MGGPNWFAYIASLGVVACGDLGSHGRAAVGWTQYQEGDAALLGYLVVHGALLKKLRCLQSQLALELGLVQFQLVLQDLLSEISNCGTLVGVGLVVLGTQWRRIELGFQEGLLSIPLVRPVEHSLSQLTRGFFVLLRHRNSRLGDFLYQFILLCKIHDIFLDPRGLYNDHQQSQTLQEKFPP
jgi:hypothetical protein